jgi:hypothetical protein
LFAKSVRERADRKWMWLVPPCAADNSSALRVLLPPAPPSGPSASEGGARAGAHERSLRALSFFAMVSPGARLVHTIGGRRVTFGAARGSLLSASWGYLQMWHLLDDDGTGGAAERAPPNDGSDGPSSVGGVRGGGGSSRSGGGRGRARSGASGGARSGASRGAVAELEWRLCAEHVAGERCVGFRCGLEFKMPMRTAAVGWFLALHA